MFKLTESFLEEFKNKKPNWGYGDLSLFTYKRTYAKLKDDGTQEEWWETCKRVIESTFSIQKDHCDKMGLPWDARKAQRAAQDAFERMFEFKWLPAGRCLEKMDYKLIQKMGHATFLNNCAFICSSIIEKDFGKPFSWTCEALSYGVGVGFSNRGAGKIIIKKPINEEEIFIIPDSREGWSESIYRLLNSYTGEKKTVIFDYSLIRPAGSPLKTFGGKASGPQPLKDGHEDIRKILNALDNKPITSVAIVDIMNIIGRFIVAGGSRRSAELALGEASDIDYIKMKDPSLFGEELASHRWASNNSITIKDSDAVSQTIDNIIKNGEPGFFFIDNARHYGRIKDGYYPDGHDRCEVDNIGGNPCLEQVLEPMELCTLCELFPVNHESFEDFQKTLKVAYLCAKTVTLTSTCWKETNQVMTKNRRIGLSQSGIQQAIKKFGPKRYFAEFCDKAYDYVTHLDKIYSRWLGIPTSFRRTSVKPSGCRPWNALTVTTRGVLTLEELFKNHKEGHIWCDSNDSVITDKGIKNISKTYDNGNALVFRIKTSGGLDLESTSNHKWFIEKKRARNYGAKRHDSINQWIETKDLEPGDVLKLEANLYNGTKPSEFEKLDSRSISMREDFSPIKQPEKMTSEIAWLIGYMWGDGSQSPSRWRIRFTDDDLGILEKAKDIILNNFGIECTLFKSKDSNSYELTACSKYLWHWFIKNGIWKYFLDDYKLDLVPYKIRSSTKDHIIAFIAGMLDAEGGFYLSQDYTTVQITNADSEFSKHLQHIGWSVGITFTRSINKGESQTHFGGPCHHLYIASSYSDINSLNKLQELSIKGNRFSHINGWRTIWKDKPIGEVIGIELVGEMQTFDIEVPDGNYYYNGAVKSHNTISLVAGATPGVHCSHSEFYLRTVRASANDVLLKAVIKANYRIEIDDTNKKQLMKALKKSGQDLKWHSCILLSELSKETLEAFKEESGTVVIYFPVKESNFTKSKNDISLWEQLTLVKELQHYWSDNSVSVTVTFSEKEAKDLGYVIEYFRPYVKSLSFLPLNDHPYTQAPYIKCTEEEYNKYLATLKPLNLVNSTSAALGDKFCNNDSCTI